MDFTKFRTADWLVIVGGAVVFVTGFLDWFDAGPLSPNAFDFTFTGLIPWLLLTSAAVLAFLVASRVLGSGAAPWELILLGLTTIGAVLLILRLVIGADLSDVVNDLAGQPDRSLDRAGGLWLSAIGGCVATAGAVMMFQAVGGRLTDLPDLQKMRDAFKR
jgi:hypothetical protein